MESGRGGELGDIVRASGGGGGGGPPRSSHQTDRWQLPSVPITSLQPLPTEAPPPSGGFVDPFSNLCRDPLLQELPATAGAIFTSRPDDSILGLVKTGTTPAKSDDDDHDEHNVSGDGGGGGGGVQNKTFGEESAAWPWTIFSRFLQISPTANKTASPTPAGRLSPPPPILVGGHDPAAGCNPPDHAGLQISPPSPQAPEIKRRKSQAKKVVCIPAPAAAGSSRPSGEVIPSDLWAWRKYGQKPIKGSPYPRGYYRCSSSKGCSARKQVERSRINPSMLVITYTSEHNHPWPTQRNALAGSTRAQLARSTSTPPPAKDRPDPYQKLAREEVRRRRECTGTVKEEGAAVVLLPSTDNNDDDYGHHDLVDRVFQQNYKDAFPEPFLSDDDFFTDLGVLEPADPMELVFSEEREDRKATPPDPSGFDRSID